MSIANSTKRYGYSWIMLGIALLVALGTQNAIFMVIALLGCLLSIVFLPDEVVISFLLFLLPYSNIFKMSPDSQSFFTYIALFYILYCDLITK